MRLASRSLLLLGSISCASAARSPEPPVAMPAHAVAASPPTIAAPTVAAPAVAAPEAPPAPPPLRIDSQVLDAVWVDATHLAFNTADALYQLDVTTQHLERQPDFHRRAKRDRSMTLGTKLAQASSFPIWEPHGSTAHFETDIYDLATLAHVRTIVHTSEPIAWSTSHELYVDSTCDDDHHCKLGVFDTRTSVQRFTVPGTEWIQPEISPDDRYLILRDSAHRRIYRLTDGTLALDAVLPRSDEFHGAFEMIELDGDRAVLTARNAVWVYDLATGKPLGHVAGKVSPTNLYGRAFDPTTGIVTLTALPGWTKTGAGWLTVIDTRKLVVRSTVRLTGDYGDCTACAAYPVGDYVWGRNDERLRIGAKAFEPSGEPGQWVAAAATLASGETSILVGSSSVPVHCTWTTGPRVIDDLPCPAWSDRFEAYFGPSQAGIRAISPDGARIAIVDRGLLTIAGGAEVVTLGVAAVLPAK
ncbi:MAG TPA: hypothetical protein VH165_02300 [Kofleriaceae bacterium]|jgi:hypothetical protein|nr:hypothetical protein [Kofleriaceae bacterium]